MRGVEIGLDVLSVMFEIVIYLAFFSCFFGKPKYAGWKMAVAYTAAAVISVYLSVTMPASYLKGLGYFLIILGLAMCYQGQLFIKFFLPFLFQTISIMVECCYSVLLMPTHEALKIYGEAGNQLHYLIGIVLSNLTILLLIKLLGSWKDQVFIKQQVVQVPLYFGLLLGFPVSVLFVIDQYYILIAELGKINLVMMLPIIFLTVLTVAFFFLFDHILRLQQEQQSIEALQWQLEQEREYHDILLEKQQQFQGLRHDMKEHFTAIASLIDLKQYDKARRYAEKQVGKLELTAVVRTGDPLVDTILTIKADAAQKLGIDFQCHVFADLQTTLIAPDDLASLFSNILNNALEAAAQVIEREKRQIICKLLQEGQFLRITVVNTASHDVVIKNNMLLTTKSDKALHGYGLKLIRQIVEKYGGAYTLSCQDQTFTIDILLPTS